MNAAKLERDAMRTLVGTRMHGHVVDDVAKIHGRWVYYFRNDEGDYMWDWMA